MLLNTFCRSVFGRQSCTVRKYKCMGSMMQHSTSVLKFAFKPLTTDTKKVQSVKRLPTADLNRALRCPGVNATSPQLNMSRPAGNQMKPSRQQQQQQQKVEAAPKTTQTKSQNKIKNSFAASKPDTKSSTTVQSRTPNSRFDYKNGDPNAQPKKTTDIEQQRQPIQSESDLRTKWMARVAPESQRKSNTKAINTTRGKDSDNTNDFRRQAMPSANSYRNNEDSSGGIKSRATSAPNTNAKSGTNKSWMSQMRNESQRKQNALLNDLKNKQVTSTQTPNVPKPKTVIGMQQQPNASQWPKPNKIQKEAGNKTEGNAEAQEDNAKEESAQQAAPPKPNDEVKDAYIKAIKELHTLNQHEERIQPSKSKDKDTNIKDTIEYLERSGLTLEELEQIPMIQVTGTKGRGSTCAIIESILQANGVRTGMYSAPHIFVTTERIRINGKPIHQKQFTELFWEIYNKMRGNASGDGKAQSQLAMPSYYKFLTIMAYHVFVREKVDVAILEVGANGASDCTNIIRNPQTIGISSLGMEQPTGLGNSMRDIAWNKAAIMKSDANVFTNATQPECLEVMKQRAKDLNVNFHKVPLLHDYIDDDLANKRILNNAHYMVRLNGSLGVQLAYDWMRKHRPQLANAIEPNTTHLTKQVAQGLSNVNWPGHFDVIKHGMFNVHLDCADSMESMLACRDWFYKQTRSSRTPKVLLFNKVNEFNSKDMLYILRSKLRFEEACFVPNPTLIEGEPIDDEEESKSMVWHGMEELQRAKQNASNWRLLCEESGRKDNSQLAISISSFFEYLQNKYGTQKYGMRPQLDVLVTGSHQLVGATINALQKLKDAGNLRN